MDKEPTFVLKASDPLASITLRNWAHLQRLSGGDALAADEAEVLAVNMEIWRLARIKHEQLKKKQISESINPGHDDN